MSIQLLNNVGVTTTSQALAPLPNVDGYRANRQILKSSNNAGAVLQTQVSPDNVTWYNLGATVANTTTVVAVPSALWVRVQATISAGNATAWAV